MVGFGGEGGGARGYPFCCFHSHLTTDNESLSRRGGGGALIFCPT